jgi:hypothetical protein
MLTRRHLVMLVALAALFVPAKAQAGGGAYVFSGGSEAARAQARAALEASSFDWGLVPATVTVRIANCGCAGSRPGLIVLDETLLAAAPYGRAYTWAVVQHEYAHQVWDFALDDGARALLRARLRGADLCYEQPGPPPGCARLRALCGHARVGLLARSGESDPLEQGNGRPPLSRTPG